MAAAQRIVVVGNGGIAMELVCVSQHVSHDKHMTRLHMNVL